MQFRGCVISASSYAILSVIGVSLISFIGLLLLRISEAGLNRAVSLLISLAVGGLLGDAFLHLIPEAFEMAVYPQTAAMSILGGILFFFLLEKFLRVRHEHSHRHVHLLRHRHLHAKASPTIHPVGYMNLISDAAHNFVDGMVIAASYLVSPSVGFATTIAVVLHEIPQEIGDYGILLHAGFTRKQALMFNFLSAGFAVLGAIIALVLGVSSGLFETYMLPVTAGGFIYLAATNLLPELQKELNWRVTAQQILMMTLGVGFMLLLTFFE